MASQYIQQGKIVTGNHQLTLRLVYLKNFHLADTPLQSFVGSTYEDKEAILGVLQ